MNTVRHVLALLAILTYLPAVAWWWVTHPFVRFWRALGRPLYYLTMILLSAVVIAVIYPLREPLLRVEFGTNELLWPLALFAYGLSVYIEVRCRRHLKLAILLGSPELAPGGHGGKLITDGIYRRIRHPRYVAVWLGTVALALFTNYLAVYVIAGALIPALYLVVVLEEKELHDRFGADYTLYAEKVPRFVPKVRP
jgi:protein-S-isoprenylcysteine O-methyltransferase Ste14